MRIVTWNCCRGPFAVKTDLLCALAPDLAVVQECARPAEESERVRWVGENPRQGVAVMAGEGWSVEPIAVTAEMKKWIVPFRVTGPMEFTLVAVWALPDRSSYSRMVCHGIDVLSDLISSGPAVVTGDFNANPVFDAKRRDWTYATIEARLHAHDLASAYHEFHREPPGEESRATYYHMWRPDLARARGSRASPASTSARTRNGRAAATTGRWWWRSGFSEIKPMTSTEHNLYSSYREVLLEHLFAGEVMKHLWLRGVHRMEVLKPQVDDGGYDLVLEADGVTRHVQMKSSHLGSTTARVTINLGLAEKPSGCVVWLIFDPSTLELGPFYWFGANPGEPLPSISEFRVARQARANSLGVKSERPAMRVVPRARFDELPDVASLIERLFGIADGPR